MVFVTVELFFQRKGAYYGMMKGSFWKHPELLILKLKSGSSFTSIKLIRKFIFIQQLVSRYSSHGSILEVT